MYQENAPMTEITDKRDRHHNRFQLITFWRFKATVIIIMELPDNNHIENLSKARHLQPTSY
jgi:hypothetical protein